MIKFGTDGWRAVIAADFTIEKAKIVFQAMADYLLDLSGVKTVAIGYDTRFLSKEYAQIAACVLAGNGINVWLSNTYISSPNVSCQIFTQKLAGGIMISASHNPPQYNGIKFKAAYAGSASIEITSRIEAKLGKNPPRFKDFSEAIASDLIEMKDFRSAYLEKVKNYVDFKRLSSLKLKVVVDSMGGAAQGYLETLFSGSNLQIMPLRTKPNPLFYGINPEPMPENLAELAAKVIELKADLGLAFDGDADRLAGIDEKGEYRSPQQIFSLLLWHLYKNRHLKGRVIKTVSVTSMIEKLAHHYGLELNETPVGFKYICAEMLKGGVLIGGEESGGIGVINHLPERDALLNALLLLELLAVSRKNLTKLWGELTKKFGPHYFRRVDITFETCDFQKIKRRLYSSSSAEDMEIGGYFVKSINHLDGYKFIFEDNKGWLMARLSGTEPVLRLYCESSSVEEVDKILLAAQKRFFLN